MSFYNWFLKVAGAESTLFFLLQPPSFYSEYSSRSRNIPISSLNPLSPLKVKSSPFSLPLLTSQTLLCSSKFSLSDTVKYDYVLSTIQELKETRVTKLSNSPYFKPEDLETDFTSSFDEVLVNFPNVDAEVFIDNTSKFFIPNHNKGARAATFLDSPTKTLSSISWGLILSCALNQPQLVVSQLVDVLNYSLSNDLLLQDSDNRFSFDPLFSFTFGLPEFNLENPQDSLSISFFSNSLLGYSVTLAIHYLQRINYFSNLLPSFYQNCLALSKSLCYVLLNSFDYSTGFCLLSSSEGIPDISKPSFNTSILASLLFNSYLQLEYDSNIHEKAARLYLSIYNSPLLPNDIFYSTFVESSSLNICTYKFWWHCEFSPANSVKLIDFYTSNRTFNSSFTEDDLLFASLVNLYSFNSRPPWIANLFSVNSPLFLEYTLNKQTTLPIHSLTPLVSSHSSFDLITKYVFNTFAIEAEAYCSFARDLLISFLPEGPFWSSRENEENSSTVIGSLIYAYSQSYFNIFIQYSLLRLPIFMSSGFILRKLLNCWFSIAKDLPEYSVRSIISLLLQSYNPEQYKSKGHLFFVLDKLNALLKQNFQFNYSPAPFFLSLSDLQSSSYSSTFEFDPSRLNQFNYLQSLLYEQQYKAIAFYPLETSTQNNGLTKTFKILSQRQTPGFPVPTQIPSSVFSNDKFVLPSSDYFSSIPLVSSTHCPSGFSFVSNFVAPVGVKLSLNSNYNLSFQSFQSFLSPLGLAHITGTIKVCNNSVCKTIII